MEKLNLLLTFTNFFTHFPLQRNWSTGALSWNGKNTVETYLNPNYTDLITFYPYSYK